MDNLTNDIIEAGYANRVLTDRLLAHIVCGTDNSRYGLVKRAMKAGNLIRIKRGHYVLNNRYRSNDVHPFQIAQAIEVGSYVSMETALAFHGWIPEAVFTTVSVTSARKSKTVNHKVFGNFSFHPLALHSSAFLVGVERHVIAEQAVLIASPLRALLDLVAYKKMKWEGLSWVTQGMRIEPYALIQTPRKDFTALRKTYKHKAVLDFLKQLEISVLSLRAGQKPSEKAGELV